MTHFQYGALVRAEFLLNGSGKILSSQYILANGRISTNRAERDSGSTPVLRFSLQPSTELSNIREEIVKANEKANRAKSAATRQKHVSKARELESLLKDVFKRLLIEKQDTISHVAFIAEYPGLDIMQFLNNAGKSGWETTGQVPGLPGPTGITMMRKRFN